MKKQRVTRKLRWRIVALLLAVVLVLTTINLQEYAVVVKAEDATPLAGPSQDYFGTIEELGNYQRSAENVKMGPLPSDSSSVGFYYEKYRFIRLGHDFDGNERRWAIVGLDANEDNSMALLSTSYFKRGPTTYGERDRYSDLDEVGNNQFDKSILYRDQETFLSRNFTSAERNVLKTVNVRTDKDDSARTPEELVVPSKLYYPSYAYGGVVYINRVRRRSEGNPDAYEFMEARQTSVENYVADSQQVLNYVVGKDALSREYTTGEGTGPVKYFNYYYTNSLDNMIWLRQPIGDRSGHGIRIMSVSSSSRALHSSESMHAYTSVANIVPVCNLETTALFASSMRAANLTTASFTPTADLDANIYTPRFAYNDSVTAKAVYNANGVFAKNASGKFLVVQTATGVYTKRLASDKEIIPASQIGGPLSQDCRVWIESTYDSVTNARMAEWNEHDFTYNDYVLNADTLTGTCILPSCGLTNKQVSITVNAPTSLTYDGNTHSVTLTDTAPAGKDFGELTILDVQAPSYYTNYVSEGAQQNVKTTPDNSGASRAGAAPVDAGTYTAVVKIVGADTTYFLTKTFTVAKKDATAAEKITVSMSDHIYRAPGQPSHTENAASQATGVIKKYYTNTRDSTEGATEWSLDSEMRKLPNRYYVFAKVSNLKNYNDYTTALVSYNVTPNSFGPTAFIAPDSTVTYDGEPHTISVSLRIDTPAGFKLQYSTDGQTWSDTAPTFTDVNTAGYTIYWKANATGYSEYANGQSILKILPKEVSAADLASGVRLSQTSYTYNGQQCKPTVTITYTDAANNNKRYTLATTDFEVAYENNINVGSGATGPKAKITLKNTGNFKFSGTDTFVTKQFTIQPLPVAIQWADTDRLYTGTEQSMEGKATVSNKVGSDTITLTYDGDIAKTAVNTGTDKYHVSVASISNSNYTLTGGTGLETDWQIRYMTMPQGSDISLTDADGNVLDQTKWSKQPVKISAPTGYQIYMPGVSTGADTYTASVIDSSDGNHTRTYYLKKITDGTITAPMTVNYKIDQVNPEGKIAVKTFDWTSLLHPTEWKYFFKGSQQAKITAADKKNQGVNEVSGIQKIEYQVVDSEAAYDANGTWTAGTSTSEVSVELPNKSKKIVYAKITDKAGNVQIINSNGLVMYQDATASSTKTFVKTSTQDLDTDITLNGNTVNSITMYTEASVKFYSENGK